MGKNIKYGEFTFPSSPARPTAMKNGGAMCKTPAGYAKGGAKREQEAVVRKEVALLRKAGAPKALISHEVREVSGEKDTPATIKAEVGMMRKAKAPLTMIKEEMMEPTGMKKGGMTQMEKKVGKVMGEFKSGELHSGSKSGPIVKNRKQAIAIGMSEGRNAGKMANGGAVEAKLEKHANMPAAKAHGPGAGNKLAKGGVPSYSKVPKFGQMK